MYDINDGRIISSCDLGAVVCQKKSKNLAGLPINHAERISASNFAKVLDEKHAETAFCMSNRQYPTPGLT